MVILIDNYDSFTYNLYQYYLMAGCDCRVIRNDQTDVQSLQRKNPSLIVLSPGPGDPTRTGICRTLVETLAGKIPIFGVCLGHQTIASVFGGKIREASAPVHGKLSTVFHQNQGVFQGLKSPLQVTRYHSLIVDEDSLPHSFTITARTENGEIMGILNEDLRLEGVQFHPEALLTECGLEMIRNSLRWTDENKGNHLES